MKYTFEGKNIQVHIPNVRETPSEKAIEGELKRENKSATDMKNFSYIKELDGFFGALDEIDVPHFGCDTIEPDESIPHFLAMLRTVVQQYKPLLLEKKALGVELIRACKAFSDATYQMLTDVDSPLAKEHGTDKMSMEEKIRQFFLDHRGAVFGKSLVCAMLMAAGIFSEEEAKKCLMSGDEDDDKGVEQHLSPSDIGLEKLAEKIRQTRGWKTNDN